MSALIPTPEDIDAAKVACEKAHGHARVVGIDYHDALTGELLTTVILAALDWPAAVAYQDNRAADVGRARALLFSERQLFPAIGATSKIRDEWAAFPVTVETAFRGAMGFSGDGDAAIARPLSVASAPPGLTAEATTALLAANAGARLWAVSHAGNGLALVWRQPTAETWSMSQKVMGDAQRTRQGVLCPALETMASHCVWTPDGTLHQHLGAAPGRARDLELPWDMMGGVAAKASSRFL